MRHSLGKAAAVFSLQRRLDAEINDALSFTDIIIQKYMQIFSRVSSVSESLVAMISSAFFLLLEEDVPFQR
jgi:hypothetical protein